MEVAVTRDPMRSKAARLRDELIRLERKQQMLSEELDGPQVAPAGFGARTANAPAECLWPSLSPHTCGGNTRRGAPRLESGRGQTP